MKVCIISNLYEPQARGGAERVAAAMAAGFVGAGHDAVVISTRPQCGLTMEEKDKQRIYRFRPLNLFYYLDLDKHGAPARLIWHFFDMLNAPSAFVVRKILQKEKPDLVITHNLMGIGFLIPLVIKRLRLKHVHVLHDVQLAVPSGLIIKGAESARSVCGGAAKVYAGICRALFGSPHAVISPSRWLLDFYSGKEFFKHSQKLVVPNPLLTPPRPVPVKQTKQNRYLFVGQLEKHKGIEWLIDFWRLNSVSDELIVAGDGTLKLANLPANVRWLGKKIGDELNTLFAQADFLIVPSLCYENSPTVIQLAFQNATPAIVADIGGAGELVKQNETGFLFEAGGADSLKKTLNAVSSLTDAKYEKLSQNSLARAIDFSLEKYVDKVALL